MKMNRLITLLWVLSSIQILIPQLSHSEEAEVESAEIAELRAKAELGFYMAQYLLGYNYDNGVGVRENDTEAVKWYRLSADQGHTIAQFNLGYMYANGLGVATDYVQAHKWYTLASLNGFMARGGFAGRSGIQSIEPKMTPEQIAEAKRLSSEWKPKTN